MDSLDRQTLRACEVLAIDNGSTDGAPDLARSRGARVIAMGRNAGFAAAVNRGIGEAKGGSLVILNTDVELAPDYLEKLAAAELPVKDGTLYPLLNRMTVDGVLDCRRRSCRLLGH